MSAVMQALVEAVVAEMKRLLDECSAKAVQHCAVLTSHITPVNNEEEENETTLEEAQQQFNRTTTNRFALMMETLTKAAVEKMAVLLKNDMAEAKPSGSAKQCTGERDETTQKRLRSGPRRVDEARRCLPAGGSGRMRKKNGPATNKDGVKQADEPPRIDNTEMRTPVSAHREEDNVQETNSNCTSETSATISPKIKKKVGNPIKCPACEKTFAQKCFFDRHYLSHSKPHLCSQCGKRFARPEGLVAHTRRHTGEKPFSCSECETHFAYKSAFNRHVRQHKIKKMCVHTCTYCEGQFHGTLAFQRHKCSALGTTFGCSVCPETFDCRRGLAEHEDLHSGERDFVCETCGERFFSSPSLSAHRVTHAQRAPCCDELGLGCSDARVLRSHLSKHTGAKLFTCDACGKGCGHLSALRHHMLTHTGEKAFVCEACGKRCGHASALQNHMRTHTGQKPGRRPLCPVCGKYLSSMVKLKYHMSVHTGEKPYACEQCGRRFSNPSNLRAHGATHTGDKLYGCTVCGRRFAQSSSLKLHRLVHTGEKPYRCAVCGKAYTHRADFKKHQSVHALSQTEEVAV